MQPITRYKFDAAIIFSDILIVPWALNQKVRFQPNTGPLLEPLDIPVSIDQKLINKLPKKLAPVAEAIRLTKEELSPETALIGFAGAPWTIMTYMAKGGTSRDLRKRAGGRGSINQE